MDLKKPFLAALLCAALLPAAPARASQLDSQLDKISKQFSKDAAAKLPDLNPATLAIFPFQAEDALARRKVDVAVGELLTQKLLREPRFRLLERAQLDTVLREQKLGLSGAIESDTAVQVGKLAGARLAALGTVTRLGRNYQISAKLVDTETSDVVSVAIAEVPASVFDEEAARYLVLVPDTQTLSIYLALGHAPMAVKNLGPVTAGGATAIPSNVKTGFNMDSGIYAGLGIKYFPFRNWNVDFALMPKYKMGESKKSVLTNLSDLHAIPAQGEGTIMRLLVNRRFGLSRGLKLYAGGGFMRFELDPSSTEPGFNAPQSLTGGSVHIQDNTGHGRYTTPLAALGLEWRPQARFGLSVLTTFPLKSDKYKWDAVLTDGSVTNTVTIWEMDYPKYMAEVNLAWYF